MGYLYFIGVDISKNNFDVAVSAELGEPRRGEPKISETQHQNYRKFSNNLCGIEEFIDYYQSILEQGLVVLESTGGYENALVDMLLCRNVAVHRADPLTAKYFIRSLGKRAKTDRLDALALMRYGMERHKEMLLVSKKTPQQEELRNLLVRIEELSNMRSGEKNRLQHPNYKSMQKSVKNVIKYLTAEIEVIEKQIEKLIDSDNLLKAKKELLITFKGIGKKTAYSLLGFMPELGTISRRKIASLLGCAPHAKDSGNIKGYRRTIGGRHSARQALFMAALTASRHNDKIKDFFNNLLKNGKKNIVAIVAVMRKMIVIINAKIRDLIIEQQQSDDIMKIAV